MPTKVGIHVFSCFDQQRRGWPAFADHDEGRIGMSGPIQGLSAHRQHRADC